jgi:hypothetical protein
MTGHRVSLRRVGATWTEPVVERLAGAVVVAVAWALNATLGKVGRAVVTAWPAEVPAAKPRRPGPPP